MKNHWIDQLREHFSSSISSSSNKRSPQHIASKRLCRASFLRFEQLENRSLFAHGMVDMFSIANAMEHDDSIDINRRDPAEQATLSTTPSSNNSKHIGLQLNRADTTEVSTSNIAMSSGLAAPNNASRSSISIPGALTLPGRSESQQSILALVSSSLKNRRNDLLLAQLHNRRGMSMPGEGEANFTFQPSSVNFAHAPSSNATGSGVNNSGAQASNQVVGNSLPNGSFASTNNGSVNTAAPGPIVTTLPIVATNNPSRVSTVSSQNGSSQNGSNGLVNAPTTSKVDQPTNVFANSSRPNLDNALLQNSPPQNALSNGRVNTPSSISSIANAVTSSVSNAVANSVSNSVASTVVNAVANSVLNSTASSIAIAPARPSSETRASNLKSLTNPSASAALDSSSTHAEISVPTPSGMVQLGVERGMLGRELNASGSRSSTNTKRVSDSLRSADNESVTDAIAWERLLTDESNHATETSIPAPAGMIAIGWTGASELSSTRISENAIETASANSTFNPFGVLHIFVGAEPVQNGSQNVHGLQQVKSVADSDHSSPDSIAVIDAVWAKRDSALFLLVSGAVVSYYWFQPKHKWDGFHRIRKALTSPRRK